MKVEMWKEKPRIEWSPEIIQVLFKAGGPQSISRIWKAMLEEQAKKNLPENEFSRLPKREWGKETVQFRELKRTLEKNGVNYPSYKTVRDTLLRAIMWGRIVMRPDGFDLKGRFLFGLHPVAYQVMKETGKVEARPF